MVFKRFGVQLKTHLTPALLIILALTAFSTGYSQKQLSEDEYAICKSKLEKAHQGFYKLSFSPEFVRDNIMPAIRTERTAVAPHFPERQAGQDSDQLFKDWIENYPNEYELYLVFLRKQHEKWRIASSSANH